MAYGKLSAQELEGAIEHTREAIRRAQAVLEIGSKETVTKGLEKVADALPSLLEKLTEDLKKLEKARDKSAEAKSEDDDEDDEDDEDEEDEDEDEDEDKEKVRSGSHLGVFAQGS
jgi:uncharacterized membrane protein YukC